jgi:hypothetical protein
LESTHQICHAGTWSRHAEERIVPKKLESRLQRQVRAALASSVGGFWYKVHGSPFQPAGIPDLAGVVLGRACFVEVKRPEGVVSRVQHVRMIELQSAGAIVTVATTPDAAVADVTAMLADGALRYCHACEKIGRPARAVLTVHEAEPKVYMCPSCSHPTHLPPWY